MTNTIDFTQAERRLEAAAARLELEAQILRDCAQKLGQTKISPDAVDDMVAEIDKACSSLIRQTATALRVVR